MLRDDYIMRQIRMLAQIVARLAGLRRAAEHETALVEIESALHRFFGMGTGLVAGLAPEDLVAELRRDTTPEEARARCALLAVLLGEHAANLAALERADEGRVFQLQALQVLLALDADAGGAPLPEPAPHLVDLAAGVHARELPRAARRALLGALERAGTFAKAEDLLFEMRADDPADAEVLALGEAFYARLERLSDAQLAAGDLPRAELAAGRAALRRRETG